MTAARHVLTVAEAAARTPVLYDLRHSFVSLLIHEGRSLADVAVQVGDAVATVAGTYTHAFVEAEGGSRESRPRM